MVDGNDRSEPRGINARNTVLDALLAFVQLEGRVCPYPQEWITMYDLLPPRRAGDKSHPGVPLILGGWEFSASAKRKRLAAQIRFAEANGVLDAVDKFLRSLPESAWYRR